MYWRNIISVHAFNVKSILCIVNYMIINNIHNRTPKSGILFTDLCKGDFFNTHNFMKLWIKVMLYNYYLWAKIESKRRYEWLRAKRSEGTGGVLAERKEPPFTIYSWIRIKYIIALCSLILRRGYLMRCAILVINIFTAYIYFQNNQG